MSNIDDLKSAIDNLEVNPLNTIDSAIDGVKAELEHVENDINELEKEVERLKEYEFMYNELAK